MDIDKLDKTAKKISTMYEQGLREVVSTLLNAKGKMKPKEFLEGMKEVDVKSALQSKLSNIKTEFAKGHVEQLESLKPTEDND